jgi:hypothetical protein
MSTFDDVASLFHSVLREGFGSRLPDQQSMLTALGAMATHKLASILSPGSVLYGLPVSRVTTAHLTQPGIHLEPLEMGVDFAAVEVDCSPKSDPGAMRVSEALQGQETNHETTYGGRDHPQTATGRG